MDFLKKKLNWESVTSWRGWDYGFSNGFSKFVLSTSRKKEIEDEVNGVNKS